MKNAIKFMGIAFSGFCVAIVIILVSMTIADLAQAKKPEKASLISTIPDEVQTIPDEVQTIPDEVQTIPDEVQTIPDEAISETTTAVVEVMEGEVQPLPYYYDVPIDYTLQDYIKELCKLQNVPTGVVMAIIERESKGDTMAMGDNGNSLGLMQIQPKWHLDRMIQLGCTDLFNEIQNVTVGIDILAELYRQNDNTAWVLMAYNSGIGNANTYIRNGQTTEYALSVMKRAYELEGGV